MAYQKRKQEEMVHPFLQEKIPSAWCLCPGDFAGAPFAGRSGIVPEFPVEVIL